MDKTIDKQKVAGAVCFTCGSPLTEVRAAIGNRPVQQCARCVSVDQLIEELVRKQLSETSFVESRPW